MPGSARMVAWLVPGGGGRQTGRALVAAARLPGKEKEEKEDFVWWRLDWRVSYAGADVDADADATPTPTPSGPGRGQVQPVQRKSTTCAAGVVVCDCAVTTYYEQLGLGIATNRCRGLGIVSFLRPSLLRNHGTITNYQEARLSPSSSRLCQLNVS